MQQIIVGQLLHRQHWASTPTFNEDVVRTNILMKEQTKDMTGINFWAHRGFWEDLAFLVRDGVHIEGHSRHMRNFMHIIQIAVIQFSRPFIQYFCLFFWLNVWFKVGLLLLISISLFYYSLCNILRELIELWMIWIFCAIGMLQTIYTWSNILWQNNLCFYYI